MSKFSDNEIKNILLDVGTFYVNYWTETPQILGATDGGGEFNVETEFHEINFDGKKGKTMGGLRITKKNANMTVNLKEITSFAMKFATNSKEGLAKDLEGETITGYTRLSAKFELLDTDYLNDLTYVGKVLGQAKPIVISIYNVLADDNFSISFADSDESTLELKVSGFWNPEEELSEVYTIDYPTGV